MNIEGIIKETLGKYLAPGMAEQAAKEIAAAVTKAVQEQVLVAVASAFGGPTEPPTATEPPAKKGSHLKALQGGKSASPPGRRRQLSPEAHLKMSFKKALSHALRRKAEKRDPLPHDKFILQASKDNKIISVEQARRLAKREANGAAAPAASGSKRAAPAKNAAMTAHAPKKKAAGTGKKKRTTKKKGNGRAGTVAADAPL